MVFKDCTSILGLSFGHDVLSCPSYSMFHWVCICQQEAGRYCGSIARRCRAFARPFVLGFAYGLDHPLPYSPQCSQVISADKDGDQHEEQPEKASFRYSASSSE